jgi:uncharacterized protein (TIGR02117 family)
MPIGSVDPQPEMDIYLISNEIHTDLVVPVKNKVFDWEVFLDPEDFLSRPSEWIEIGWGDRQFYFEIPTWDKFSLNIALNALLFPSDAIIHINYLNDHPMNYSSAKKISISYATYQKLVKEIHQRFKTKQHRPILIEGKGYSSSDNFYEAHGNFSLVRTCNVWTSEILAAGELKHPLWSPTKYGLQFLW